MAVTSLLKPRSIARKALSFYIQKAGSNQGAAFDFITYLADKLYKVLINSDDTEAGYLEDKLTASGFSEIEINTDVDGVKSININSEADIGDLNDVVITDIQDGDVLAYDADTQNFVNTQKSDKNDKVKISSDDGSADYLENKLVEGDYITIAKETDIAGKQTLKISSTGGGSDPTAFTELSDVPQSYTDQAGKMLVVNEGETALEFTESHIIADARASHFQMTPATNVEVPHNLGKIPSVVFTYYSSGVSFACDWEPLASDPLNVIICKPAEAMMFKVYFN